MQKEEREKNMEAREKNMEAREKKTQSAAARRHQMKLHRLQANDQETTLFTCPAQLNPTQPNNKRKSCFALAIRWTTLLGRMAFIARRCASSTWKNPTSSIINRRRFASYHNIKNIGERERERERKTTVRALARKKERKRDPLLTIRLNRLS